MRKAFSTVLLLCCLFSNGVNAAPSCSGTSCTGLAQELIIQLFPTGGNGYRQILITSPLLVNSAPCSGASGGANISLDDSDPVFEEAYAMLLSAYHLNSNIILKVDSSKPVCTLLHVRLKQ